MSLIGCILTLHLDEVSELQFQQKQQQHSYTHKKTTEPEQRAPTSIHHLRYFRDLIKNFHAKWICSLCKRTKLKRSS